jgi:hypothetical protein
MRRRSLSRGRRNRRKTVPALHHSGQNFPDSHVRVVNRNISTLNEANTKEPVRGKEYPFVQYRVERKIRGYLRFVEIVFSASYLLSIP